MGDFLVEALGLVSRSFEEAAPDLAILRFTVVNAFIIGRRYEEEWVLIDTGLENSGGFIIECAEKRFGEGTRPRAIILTHGHFDHIGSVRQLAGHWDVPVYVHPEELPYLTGKKDYPLADPGVDSGLVAKISPGFPHRAINLGDRARSLPPDHTLPGLPDWQWIHTPGHTAGHVALFRKRDGVLIAGDAFTTTKQESLWSVLSQKEEMHGPPAYLTTDWQRARESVQRLRDLEPEVVLPSHGTPMKGRELQDGLEWLIDNFQEKEVPKQGRFV